MLQKRPKSSNFALQNVKNFCVMKRNLLFLAVILLFASCSKIPNKSVFEDLTTDELASAIKSEPEFGDFYEGMHALVKMSAFTEVQKAQFKDVTYRSLYKYSQHADDSTFWAPKQEKWAQEWDANLAPVLAQVDDKMKYWSDYKEQNSLSRFVKVELSDFYFTYYSYIHSLKEAYICFKLTPVDGPIEQLKFRYSYSYKINSGRGKKSHNCIYSSPVSAPKEGMWEIEYFERDDFSGMTVQKFLQQYDLNIEVTDVRKDGVNYSLDDLNIPEAVTNLWDEDTEANRDAVATLIDPSYVNKAQYLTDKKDADMKKFDENCYNFLDTLKSQSLGGLLQSLFE